MSSALKRPPARMTVAEFLKWDSGDHSGAIWQLRDGEPEMMAPATDAHGSIQGEAFRLIANHLIAQGGRFRAVITPGVIPRLRSDRNMLVPDIGVTCSPPSSGHALPNPILLIEVLSPTNEAQTRANLWAYTTIPTVEEIWLLSSTAISAEVLHRSGDGTWPEQPEMVGVDGEIRADSIGLTLPLREIYRFSGLR